jgi:arylsulfatase A-like enzyme
LDRRGFLKALGLAAPALALQPGGRAARAQPVAPPKLPNILIVLADDMGFGDLGCYNPASKIPTPRMDRLAREGVRFTDAHSPSALCSPTRYGLLTGRYAWRTRLQKFVLMPYEPPLIEPGRLTLGSLLGQAGYETAYVGKWHLGLRWTTKDGSPAEDVIDHADWRKSDWKRQWNVDFAKPLGGGPRELGFDHFFGTAGCCTSDPPYCFIENDRAVTVPTRMSRDEWEGLPGFLPGPMADDWSEEECDYTLTGKAIDFIDAHVRRHPDRPFFLIHSLSSPHNPFLPPAETKGKSGAGARGDLVMVVDWAVGRIADHLDERGLAGDTLLIVTSDNGAVRGENGHASADGYRGFKAQVWEGGHRVPFILRWPGVVRPGTTSAETISLIDLCASFAALTGQALPDDAAEDSGDVLPALLGRGPARRPPEARIFDSGNGEFAIRQGRWKAVAGDLESLKTIASGGKPGQLFDLEADPGETSDVWAAHPETGRAMIGLLVRYRAEGRSRPRSRSRLARGRVDLEPDAVGLERGGNGIPHPSGSKAQAGIAEERR